MINTLIKNSKAETKIINLPENIYLLPQWEKIKEFNFKEKRFLSVRNLHLGLFRKFSARNMLEKYSIKNNADETCAFMDLKVYKDNVYIINLDAQHLSFYNELIEKLVQVAIEKALYNTSKKEVRINLSLPLLKHNKMKSILLSLGFIPEENQSKYEKEMFGETLCLKAEYSLIWQKKIKQAQILINK